MCMRQIVKKWWKTRNIMAPFSYILVVQQTKPKKKWMEKRLGRWCRRGQEIYVSFVLTLENGTFEILHVTIELFVSCLVWASPLESLFISVFSCHLRFISYGICHYCTKTIEWMVNNNEKNTKKNNGHTNTIANNNEKQQQLKMKMVNESDLLHNTQRLNNDNKLSHLSLVSVSIFYFEIGNCHRKEMGDFDCWKSFPFGFTFHLQFDQTVCDWLTLSSGLCSLFAMRLTFGQNELEIEYT